MPIRRGYIGSIGALAVLSPLGKAMDGSQLLFLFAIVLIAIERGSRSDQVQSALVSMVAKRHSLQQDGIRSPPKPSLVWKRFCKTA
ncbi:hypothetical protein [Mesorhizobium sp. BR-1-1-10]|uniref:hypothetical protein n=1 Tax=Mesorhizobium sp. BR-1-1-10 TaxID=2876660 RepID=UPI0029625BA0|nr:hypothetical protein [Mesorhizobium sp. BR-1-1-10]